MYKISAKKLSFYKLSNYFQLDEDNNVLLYYIPTKWQNTLKTELKTYNVFDFHKRNIKHSSVGIFIKNHFTPGAGALKFKTVAELDKFLKISLSDFRKKVPGFLPVTLIVRKTALFYFSFKYLDATTVYFKNLSFFFSFLKNSCSVWLHFIRAYLRFLCKLICVNIKNKHANA